MRQNHLRIDATRDMRSCFASDVENERPHGPKPPPWRAIGSRRECLCGPHNRRVDERVRLGILRNAPQAAT